MRNKLLSICLVLTFLAVFPLTAAAQGFDPQQEGSLSVSLISKNDNTPMAGAELSLFYVAVVEHNAAGHLIYRYTEEFSDCGFPLDDPDLVRKLDAFVTENNVASRKLVTDSQGSASCQALPLGLYFVKQTGEAEGFALSSSFLVTIPLTSENGNVYHVDASPKTDVVRLTDVTVRKVWNTGNTAAVPGSVTVQLLRHDQVVETAVLNSHNNWKITYTNLPESDGYSIKEVNIPQGFTATYTQAGYVFTVTNTPSLAQTGQLVWPIPFFALAGMFFLVVGFAILGKSGKCDA